MPNIRNFKEIGRYITTHPRDASILAQEWSRFKRRAIQTNPDLISVQTSSEWYQWLAKHPEVHADPSLWVAKEVGDAFPYIQNEALRNDAFHKEERSKRGGGALASAALGVAALPFSFKKPEIMEHDSKYNKIREQLQKEWLKTNNQKDFQSKEGLDYMYGSLDSNEKSELDKKAEELFRQKHQKAAEYYDKKARQIKKSPEKDWQIWHTEAQMLAHTKERLALLPEGTSDDEKKALEQRIKDRGWRRFIEEQREKADAYANKHEELGKTLNHVTTEEQLQKYKEESEARGGRGVEVKETEKIHRDGPRMTHQEATARLETISQQTQAQTPQPGLVNASGNLIQPIQPPPPQIPQLSGPPEIPQNQLIIPHAPRAVPPSPLPAPHEPSQNRQGGVGSRFFNSLQNGKLSRLGSKLGRTPTSAGNVANLALKQGGKFLVQQGARVIAAGTSEIWLPILLIVIGLLLLIVLVVVIFVGASNFNPPGDTTLPPGVAREGDISTCLFYRGGDKTQGVKIGNPEMAKTISAISQKVGVPAAIVAGIMRVETGQALASTDPTYLANDYDNHSSGVAYGVMQFTPQTFAGTFRTNSGELNTLFGKQSVSIDANVKQDSMEPASVFRIYSVKDSITAAAFKVRADKRAFNGDEPWSEAAANAVARAYYGCLLYGSGGCTSGPYSYGADLWKSYSECRTTIGGTLAGWPTDGILTQGPQGAFDHIRIYNGSKAESVDIADFTGPPLYSTFNGFVRTIHDCTGKGDCYGGYGNSVLLEGSIGSGSAQPFTVLYGHLSQIDVSAGDRVDAGQRIGRMGTTGVSTGVHLHWEFRGISLAPPNIPEPITPPNCDSPAIPCTPYKIRASGRETDPQGSGYWFLLHRKSQKETLFKGTYGDQSKSEVVKNFDLVKTGRLGRATPLPQKLGRKYWKIVGKKIANSDETKPYFLTLDIPYDTSFPGYSQVYQGPAPYEEAACDETGQGRSVQCNWVTPGAFGLHGVNGDESRLSGDNPGSSGCIRHTDTDITYLYNLLNPANEEIRYYIVDD